LLDWLPSLRSYQPAISGKVPGLRTRSAGRRRHRPLQARHQITGLKRSWQGLRPWDNGGEFSAPADITELDHLDAARVLAALWDRQMPSAVLGAA